jgi:hypothetical protein
MGVGAFLFLRFIFLHKRKKERKHRNNVIRIDGRDDLPRF